MYWVVVTDANSCEAVDSVNIVIDPLPFVFLGSDTSFCEYEQNLVLDAGSGYSYLWNTGDTTQYLSISQSGIYELVVENGCGTDRDSIQVDINPAPDLFLGNDTTICGSSSYLLYSDGQCSSYMWQDNSNTPFYNVTATGSYWLTVSNSYNCETTDDIFVTLSSPSVDLGPDTFVCENDSLILDAVPGFSQYYWNNLITDQTMTV